jgi:hypothetical protein
VEQLVVGCSEEGPALGTFRRRAPLPPPPAATTCLPPPRFLPSHTTSPSSCARGLGVVINRESLITRRRASGRWHPHVAPARSEDEERAPPRSPPHRAPMCLSTLKGAGRCCAWMVGEGRRRVSAAQRSPRPVDPRLGSHPVKHAHGQWGWREDRGGA